MEEKLVQLGFSEIEINELVINSRNSEYIAQVFNILSVNSCSKDIQKKLIELISEIDTMKPLSVDVKTLSLILGLSVRQINTLRKENKIPFIKLSGDLNQPGRKTYVYEIEKVKEALGIKSKKN